MKNRTRLIPLFLAMAVFSITVLNAPAATLITEYEDQSSSVSVKTARMNGQPGVAVVFEGTDDLHYYATSAAAPAPGMELKVSAKAENISFGDAVYPEYQYFKDAAKGKIEVYVGNFKVFLPIGSPVFNAAKAKDVTITIEGIACTS